jgi:cellulose synthase/poly-beta-1,6-N-acetylglucosamine synthase-like glycosyltransferase
MSLAVVYGSLALIVYTYAGYPVLVVALARFLGRPVRRDPAYRPRVSVLIPAFNSAELVGPKLDSLLAQSYPRELLEILVYSDGSTDDTEARVLAYGQRHGALVRLLTGASRQGKPTALNRMREVASGEVLVLTDIRQPLSETAIASLVATIADPAMGCASGNLVLGGDTGAGLYWRYEKAIRMAESRFRSLVGVTGALYAIRRADLPEVPADTILDDMWIPMRLALQRRRIVLVGEAVAFDQAAEDDREFGRKVRTLAGNYQLLARLPRLLVPLANPLWFETFSHKILRLVCPWAMAALAVGSIACVVAPPPGLPAIHLFALRVLLAGEVAFAAAALAGRSGGRLAGVARTFVVLNWAAVVGLYRFVRGEQRITW